MEITIGIILLGICIIGIGWNEKKKKLKRIRIEIAQSYGKVPKIKNPQYEEIEIHWKENNHKIPKNEKIDEITWNDLDMKQIFDRLNGTRSYIGEQMLFSKLHLLPKDKKQLELFENEIQYYDAHNKQREEMQFLLWKLGKNEVNYYLPMFVNTLEDQGISNRWFYRLMQVLLFSSVLPVIIARNTAFLGITGVIFLINIVIYTIKSAEYEVYVESLNGIIAMVKLVKNLVADKSGLCEVIPEDVKIIIEQFDKLTHMITKLQTKSNAGLSGDAIMMAQVYIMGATLKDFIKYNKVIEFLKDKKKEVMTLYEFIGNIDVAITIGSFRQSVPFYCKPQFVKDKQVYMKEMYHPLIENAVCNTVKLERNCLITGSNASGKSTFIKAAALNVILAHSIHTCMAQEMILSDSQVVTSMAIRDDVMSGESYYIKEIKYLKRIIDEISQDRLVICVVDEILRGTNTVERIAASSAVLRYLSKSNCLALVASHDIELTHILRDQYELFYFCEQINDKDIVFDYKMHQGASNSRNAIRLLEYVGFPEEIIKDAMNVCPILS